MLWWFNTKVALHNGSATGYGNGIKASNLGSQSQASQHACSSLCDEVVILWRLAALNPGLSGDERDLLRQQFSEWHVKVIDKVTKSKGLTVNANHGGAGHAPAGNGAGPSTPRRTSQSFKAEIEVFTGFKPSIEACYLSWDDYPVPGVTYTQGHRLYHCPFTCFRHSETHGRFDIGPINSSSAVLKNDLPVHMLQRRAQQQQQQQQAGDYSLAIEDVRHERLGAGGHDGFPIAPVVRPDRMEMDRAGNRSSVSSEGFCENEGDPAVEAFEPPMASGLRDLTRQDSDDPALGSDTNEPEVLAVDSCTSTDKEKSSPEDFDADSDWSGIDARRKNSSQMGPNRNTGVPLMPTGSSMKAGSSRDTDDPANFSTSPQGERRPTALPALGAVPREPCMVTVANRNGGVFGELKPLEDPLDILFARAEGLHAHGHSAEACELGIQLATELLANPPDLLSLIHI